MKRKIALGLCTGLLTLSLVGCSSAPEAEKTPEAEKPPVEEKVDAVGTASLPATIAEFEQGIAADGRWIVTPVADITSENELVIDGEFFKKDDEAEGAYRKIGLYAQDADKNITAEYTLTTPKLVIKSENTNIQNGTVKGDIYVEANGFVLKNTKVEGNVYFASEDVKSTFTLDGEASVSGAQEVK